MSSDSSWANSSALASIRSPMRHSRWERSRGVIRDHGEGDSNALRAATTARSMSTAEAWATWTSTSSVAGSIVAKVLPSFASTHSPSIRSCLGEDRNERTAGRRLGRSCDMGTFQETEAWRC